MKDLIEIENIATYPKNLISFFEDEEEKEILFNTFENKKVNLDSSTWLYKHIAQILNEEYFYALHASRLIDSNSIINNGIVIPSNSEFLFEQLLNNIKNEFDKKELDNIKKTLYIKQKEENIYHGFEKYNKIWFILGNLKDISLDNGLYMLEKYGGEFLEDTFTELGKKKIYFEKIAKKGKPYAVEFKIQFKQIEYYKQGMIINRILEKYLFNIEADYSFMEAYTTENITKEQIITIAPINIEEK